MKSANRSGFTLIELMVVVIIIAALAGMVLPHVLPASNEAKRKIARGDIANITMAVKMYRLHNNRYPSTSEGLDILMKPSTQTGWNEPYLERAPIDPWGNKYKYVYPGSRGAIGFDLYSAGPDGQEGTEDDVSNWDKE